jgi:hypothetical protein
MQQWKTTHTASIIIGLMMGVMATTAMSLDPYNIYGEVTYQDNTDTPSANITIYINGELHTTMTTSEEGKYTLVMLNHFQNGDTINITAEKNGYEAAHSATIDTTNPGIQINLQLPYTPPKPTKTTTNTNTMTTDIPPTPTLKPTQTPTPAATPQPTQTPLKTSTPTKPKPTPTTSTPQTENKTTPTNTITTTLLLFLTTTLLVLRNTQRK